jgi:hypothetical protein
VYRNGALRLPLLTACVSAERLFDAFLDLVPLLGDEVSTVLESSHDHTRSPVSYRRTGMDTPVLLSHFCDYEDLLMNDGSTGVAVMSTRRPVEVQFDEHKLFNIYAADLKPYARVLRRHGVRKCDDLALISEGEHLHHSTPSQASLFEEFCLTLGVSKHGHVLSDESHW